MASNRLAWFCAASLLAAGCSAAAPEADAGGFEAGPLVDTGARDAGIADAGARDAAEPDGGDARVVCSVDLDCADATFCNGAERCAPGDARADARGCVASTGPACLGTQQCEESTDRCISNCDIASGDADGDGRQATSCGGDDCDDADPERYPGAFEVCDAAGRDEDCNPMTFGARDQDGDGAVDARCCNVDTSNTRRCGDDCGDTDRSLSPSASEVCDGQDNDCDGQVDEGVSVAGFADLDGDLHGDRMRPIRGCAGLAGLSPLGDDCDDANPARHPAQVEVCNLRDDDCDAMIDEDTAMVPLFRDLDGDGFGAPASGTRTACVVPAGYSVLGTDCDDADMMVHPGVAEQCNGRDDDCDGRPNHRLGLNDTEDDDLDGFADARCNLPRGDCDDRNATVFPGAPELDGDGVDNDCDTRVDDACAQTRWYVDADGDGYGNDAMASIMACTPQAGRAVRGGDCDDASATRSPGARELCNGVDDDCDGTLDAEAADRTCARPAALGRCQSGACRISVCELGTDNCDLMAPNGCETSLADDVSNCGRCGTECGFGAMSIPACVDYTCGLTCAGGFADCNTMPADGCEVQTTRDVQHCGRCGNRCPTRPNATPVCQTSACALACTTGFGDCDGDAMTGCEIDTQRDVRHCGRCGSPCTGTGEICVAGACQQPLFASTGAEGDFMPTVSTVLSPGVHHFARIRIPVGVRVTTTGSGVLELRATGDVEIAGTIDVSGSNGGDSLRPTFFEFNPGGGGTTGNPLAVAYTYTVGDTCLMTTTGGGGAGAPGGDAPGAAGNRNCGAGGANGGGVGGRFAAAGGGGGGGYAGGGGGGGGGVGASLGGDMGGTGGGTVGAMTCVPATGGVAPGAYGGGSGGVNRDCNLAGGGGSIGASAAADLAVATTFRPGSAGGGGGPGYYSAGGGGGGAGGALRISSPTRITLTADGRLLANGGRGGDGTAGGAGGGSGGVVFLAAPSLALSGAISAVGGLGGNGFDTADGGRGGLGRIRLSVLQSECTITSAAFTPPLATPSCAASAAGGVAATTYVATYPR